MSWVRAMAAVLFPELDDAEVDRALEWTRSEIARQQQQQQAQGGGALLETAPGVKARAPEPESPTGGRAEPEHNPVQTADEHAGQAGPGGPGADIGSPVPRVPSLAASTDVVQPSGGAITTSSAPQPGLVTRGADYTHMCRSPLRAAQQRLQWAKGASSRLAAAAPGSLDHLDVDVLWRVAELVTPRYEAVDWSFIQASACSQDNVISTTPDGATVHQVVSPVTGESFAIKLVKRSAHPRARHLLHPLAGQRDRLDGELRMASKLRHPGVCRLVHVASDSKFYMVVTELCETCGGSLFDEVAKGGLTEHVARVYFRQVVSAISYCHSKGVWRRNLRTGGGVQLEDVFVKDVATRQIKILGFGISLDRGVSEPRVSPPTPIFNLPPELLMNLEGVTEFDGQLVDVWAMGVLLYTMVVCSYPFGLDAYSAGSKTRRQVFRNITSGLFSFPPRLELSAEIRELITQMLTVDPAQRITVAQISQHPWVCPSTGGGEAGEDFDDVPFEYVLPEEPAEVDESDESDENFDFENFGFD